MPRQPIAQKKGDDDRKTIQDGLKDILGRNQSQLKLADLYECVSNLVNSNPNILRKDLNEILTKHFVGWRNELSRIAGNPLIARFSVIYDDYINYCKIIPKIYSLYDRRNNDKENGETLILIRQLFQEKVLSNYSDVVMKDTTNGIIKEIHIARSQNNIDLKNISNLIKMYFEFRYKLDIFSVFYDHLQKDTTRYYDDFFKAHYDGSSFPTYLLMSSEQFAKEESIMKEIFDERGEEDEQNKMEIEKQRKEILNFCLYSLLINNEDKFLHGDEPPISIALTNQDKKPLRWLVDTYRRFDIKLEDIYTSCAKYIENQMLNLSANFKEKMKSTEISANIEELIQLTNDFTTPYQLIFKDVKDADETLEKAIKEAWNNEKFNIEENFSIYIDTQFKNEFKNLKAEEREQFPATVEKFYTRLEDKKKFTGFYDISMVRRFIKMGLRLVDIESPTINAIRKANSHEFGKSFKDYQKTIEDSQELESKFKEEIQNDPQFQGKTIGFQPIVFDQKKFPLEKIIARILPPQIQPINDAFCHFYSKKHPNFQLHLLQDVSTVESKFYVPKNKLSQQARTYTVSSDIICATIIQAVSEKPLKYPELLNLINDQKTLDSNMKRLITSQIIKPELKGVKKNENSFSLNPEFHSKISRVIIPPVVNERKKDNVNVNQTVDVQKTESIKAAIVRVLKKNTRIEQVQLEGDVINEMAPYFRANVDTIRKVLIELERDQYFTRSEVNGTQFLDYIA